MSSTLTSFGAALKAVYNGSFLRDDGTWMRTPAAAPPAEQPAPQPDPIPDEPIKGHQVEEILLTRSGYTRSDLDRMRRVEQLRLEMDRGLK